MTVMGMTGGIGLNGTFDPRNMIHLPTPMTGPTFRDHFPTCWDRQQHRTCCNNIGYHGFFDRIVSNFGTHLAPLLQG